MAGRDTVENVDVTISATDKASKVVDGVADRLEDLDDVELEVKADDQATDTLEAVEADRKKLDGADATVQLDDHGAEKLKADIHAILEGAQQVDKADATLDVDVSGAEESAKKLRGVGDAADTVGRESISSVDSLRDVSGALGDAGGAALDTSEGLLGLGETLSMIDPRFERFAKTLGVAGLAFAGLSVLGGIVDKLTGQADAAADALSRINTATGQGTRSVQDFVEAVAEGRKGLFDVTATLKNYRDVLSGNDPLKADAVERFNEILGKSAPAAANLLAEIERMGALSAQSADQVEQMTAALEANIQGAAAADQAQKSYNQAVDDAKTLLEAGQAIRRRDGESITEWTTDLHTAAEAIRDQGAELDRVTASTLAAAKATDDHTAALKAEADRLTAASDAMHALADSSLGVARAQRQWEQASSDLDDQVKEINQSNDDAATKQRRLADLYDDTAGKADAVATSYVGMAEDQAKSAGTTVTATQKLDLYNASMLAAANSASGPLQASIVNYIATVNGIPPEKVTEILASTPNLEEQKAKLAEASKNRSMTITVDANTQPAEHAVNDLLDEISRAQARLTLGANFMAGTPYAPGGFATLGEAGPERVYLPRGSRVVSAGQTANLERAGTAGTTIINVNVHVAPFGPPSAEVATQVAAALDLAERRAGRRRRAVA